MTHIFFKEYRQDLSSLPHPEFTICEMKKQKRKHCGKHYLQYQTYVHVDRGFCPDQSHSYSFPKKQTEVYINHTLVGLLSKASYQ